MSSEEKEKCTCVLYEPGLVSFECDNCKQKRLARQKQKNRDGNFRHGVGGDGDQQAD